MTTDQHNTAVEPRTISDAECRDQWTQFAAEYHAAKEAADAETARDVASDTVKTDPAIVARLLDARDSLSHTYAPHWAGIGQKAAIFAHANEDDGWRKSITHGSPNYWLAQVIDLADEAGDGEPSDTDRILVMQLVGAAECLMRSFLTHPDGFSVWGCNPAALESNVGMIAGIQQDARRLANRGDKGHAALAAAVFNTVWFDAA